LKRGHIKKVVKKLEKYSFFKIYNCITLLIKRIFSKFNHNYGNYLYHQWEMGVIPRGKWEKKQQKKRKRKIVSWNRKSLKIFHSKKAYA